MNIELINWLLTSDEPWTRYRTQLDLLNKPQDDDDVQTTYQEMLEHTRVRQLIDQSLTWPGYALRRHNDAKHPLYALSTLADFGLRVSSPGIKGILDKVMGNISDQGAVQILINIPRAFGGTDEDQWAWVLCDYPTLLYALLQMGLAEDQRVQKSVAFLASMVAENGWRCTAAPELGKFKGPGRKNDPCPIANVYALKALSLVPEMLDSPTTRAGTEALLSHWELRKVKKYFLFGIGSDFHKIKYPYIWYDILHVIEVLSRFPFIHRDPRFIEMLQHLREQGDAMGHYTAGSMYQAWKGWSFADKKNPSPWLTFLTMRIFKRCGI